MKNFMVIFLFLGFHLNLLAQNESLTINKFRILGSHNSYKVSIEPALFDLLLKNDSALARSLEYSHVSFTKQLDLGLRALEIDVYHDPKGGLYNSPMGINLLKQSGIQPQPYDPEKKLLRPGLKVLHIQDLDFRSSQLLFKDALQEIVNWSNLHPDHFPIIITMNAKDETIDRPGFVKPLSFTHSALDSIDMEIRQIIPEEKLLTPDKVKGKFASLEKAVLTQGWPTLKKAKGKIMFVLDEHGEKLETYRKDHPSLKDRVLFVLAEPGEPEAAFLIINDAKKDGNKIKQLVEKGYFVRTRADSDTREARREDYSGYQAARESKAQIISTDYYWPSKPFGTNYSVFFRVEPTDK